jgi:hypothetical protein
MISNLIHIELAHINTRHPDFIGGERAVQEAMRLDEAFTASGKSSQAQHMQAPTGDVSRFAFPLPSSPPFLVIFLETLLLCTPIWTS